MSGRRHKVGAIGRSYEDFVASLVGRIASLVKVPREEDYGVDFYCQPLVSTGPQTQTVSELGSLQVKGGSAKLAYGGVNERGEWRDYEITWLRSLATPLYLVHVDADFTAVELFSLWPLWWIFWKTGFPFEVVFSTQAAGMNSTGWREPESSPGRDGEGQGDGKRWVVCLGPPFLRLTTELLNDSTFRERAAGIMRAWIAQDRLILMFHQLFIPVLTGISRWTTNSTEGTELVVAQLWRGEPGANIERICQTASPYWSISAFICSGRTTLPHTILFRSLSGSMKKAGLMA